MLSQEQLQALTDRLRKSISLLSVEQLQDMILKWQRNDDTYPNTTHTSQQNAVLQQLYSQVQHLTSMQKHAIDKGTKRQSSPTTHKTGNSKLKQKRNSTDSITSHTQQLVEGFSKTKQLQLIKKHMHYAAIVIQAFWRAYRQSKQLQMQPQELHQRQTSEDQPHYSSSLRRSVEDDLFVQSFSSAATPHHQSDQLSQHSQRHRNMIKDSIDLSATSGEPIQCYFPTTSPRDDESESRWAIPPPVSHQPPPSREELLTLLDAVLSSHNSRSSGGSKASHKKPTAAPKDPLEGAVVGTTRPPSFSAAVRTDPSPFPKHRTPKHSNGSGNCNIVAPPPFHEPDERRNCWEGPSTTQHPKPSTPVPQPDAHPLFLRNLGPEPKPLTTTTSSNTSSVFEKKNPTNNNSSTPGWGNTLAGPTNTTSGRANTLSPTANSKSKSSKTAIVGAYEWKSSLSLPSSPVHPQITQVSNNTNTTLSNLTERQALASVPTSSQRSPTSDKHEEEHPQQQVIISKQVPQISSLFRGFLAKGRAKMIAQDKTSSGGSGSTTGATPGHATTTTATSTSDWEKEQKKSFTTKSTVSPISKRSRHSGRKKTAPTSATTSSTIVVNKAEITSNIRHRQPPNSPTPLPSHKHDALKRDEERRRRRKHRVEITVEDIMGKAPELLQPVQAVVSQVESVKAQLDTLTSAMTKIQAQLSVTEGPLRGSPVSHRMTSQDISSDTEHPPSTFNNNTNHNTNSNNNSNFRPNTTPTPSGSVDGPLLLAPSTSASLAGGEESDANVNGGTDMESPSSSQEQPPRKLSTPSEQYSQTSTLEGAQPPQENDVVSLQEQQQQSHTLPAMSPNSTTSRKLSPPKQRRPRGKRTPEVHKPRTKRFGGLPNMSKTTPYTKKAPPTHKRQKAPVLTQKHTIDESSKIVIPSDATFSNEVLLPLESQRDEQEDLQKLSGTDIASTINASTITDQQAETPSPVKSQGCATQQQPETQELPAALPVKSQGPATTGPLETQPTDRPSAITEQAEKQLPTTENSPALMGATESTSPTKTTQELLHSTETSTLAQQAVSAPEELKEVQAAATSSPMEQGLGQQVVPATVELKERDLPVKFMSTNASTAEQRRMRAMMRSSSAPSHGAIGRASIDRAILEALESIPTETSRLQVICDKPVTETAIMRTRAILQRTLTETSVSVKCEQKTVRTSAVCHMPLNVASLSALCQPKTVRTRASSDRGTTKTLLTMQLKPIIVRTQVIIHRPPTLYSLTVHCQPKTVRTSATCHRLLSQTSISVPCAPIPVRVSSTSDRGVTETSLSLLVQPKTFRTTATVHRSLTQIALSEPCKPQTVRTTATFHRPVATTSLSSMCAPHILRMTTSCDRSVVETSLSVTCKAKPVRVGAVCERIPVIVFQNRAITDTKIATFHRVRMRISSDRTPVESSLSVNCKPLTVRTKPAISDRTVIETSLSVSRQLPVFRITLSSDRRPVETSLSTQCHPRLVRTNFTCDRTPTIALLRCIPQLTRASSRAVMVQCQSQLISCAHNVVFKHVEVDRQVGEVTEQCYHPVYVSKIAMERDLSFATLSMAPNKVKIFTISVDRSCVQRYFQRSAVPRELMYTTCDPVFIPLIKMKQQTLERNTTICLDPVHLTVHKSSISLQRADIVTLRARPRIIRVMATTNRNVTTRIVIDGHRVSFLEPTVYEYDADTKVEQAEKRAWDEKMKLKQNEVEDIDPEQLDSELSEIQREIAALQAAEEDPPTCNQAAEDNLPKLKVESKSEKKRAARERMARQMEAKSTLKVKADHEEKEGVLKAKLEKLRQELTQTPEEQELDDEIMQIQREIEEMNALQKKQEEQEKLQKKKEGEQSRREEGEQGTLVRQKKEIGRVEQWETVEPVHSKAVEVMLVKMKRVLAFRAKKVEAVSVLHVEPKGVQPVSDDSALNGQQCRFTTRDGKLSDVFSIVKATTTPNCYLFQSIATSNYLRMLANAINAQGSDGVSAQFFVKRINPSRYSVFHAQSTRYLNVQSILEKTEDACFESNEIVITASDQPVTVGLTLLATKRITRVQQQREPEVGMAWGRHFESGTAGYYYSDSSTYYSDDDNPTTHTTTKSKGSNNSSTKRKQHSAQAPNTNKPPRKPASPPCPPLVNPTKQEEATTGTDGNNGSPWSSTFVQQKLQAALNEQREKREKEKKDDPQSSEEKANTPSTSGSRSHTVDPKHVLAGLQKKIEERRKRKENGEDSDTTTASPLTILVDRAAGFNAMKEGTDEKRNVVVLDPPDKATTPKTIQQGERKAQATPPRRRHSVSSSNGARGERRHPDDATTDKDTFSIKTGASIDLDEFSSTLLGSSDEEEEEEEMERDRWRHEKNPQYHGNAYDKPKTRRPSSGSDHYHRNQPRDDRYRDHGGSRSGRHEDSYSRGHSSKGWYEERDHPQDRYDYYDNRGPPPAAYRERDRDRNNYSYPSASNGPNHRYHQYSSEEEYPRRRPSNARTRDLRNEWDDYRNQMRSSLGRTPN